MLKWIESIGRNEDAAIEAALTQLGLSRDEVSVEVLERAKTGFLGIGSCPAKVKVSYEAPDEEIPVPEVIPTVEKKVENKPAKKPERKPAKKQEQPKAKAPQPKPEVVPAVAKPALVTTAVAEDDDCAQRIVAFLEGLLSQMGTKANIEVKLDERGNYRVELLGEGLGALIGRRGETLDAIQQLTSYAVNRSEGKRVRIHLDAENYRAKREEALEQLAHKVAGKVVKYRRNVTLESMNAYERHVIHTALQDVPNITTYSVGNEPNRRTVVAYGTKNNNRR